MAENLIPKPTNNPTKQALQSITFYQKWPKVKCRGCGRLYGVEPVDGVGLHYRHPEVKKCPDSGLLMKMGLYPAVGVD